MSFHTHARDETAEDGKRRKLKPAMVFYRWTNRYEVNMAEQNDSWPPPPTQHPTQSTAPLSQGGLTEHQKYRAYSALAFCVLGCLAFLFHLNVGFIIVPLVIGAINGFAGRALLFGRIGLIFSLLLLGGFLWLTVRTGFQGM